VPSGWSWRRSNGPASSRGPSPGSPASSGLAPESLRHWVRQAEVDRGTRVGLTTEERERMKTLERENRELRRANEILKSAAAFFGAELDRRSTK
jgi:transposase